MADLAQRVSPLGAMAEAFRRASGHAVSIAEQPFLAQVALRGNPADAVFARAAADVLGLALSARVGEVGTAPWGSALALGPDEWLLVGDAVPNNKLRTALAGVHASLIDVSCNRTAIILGGPRARDVLLKGIGLDLHPRAFGPRACAQTLIARTQVILEQLDGSPRYRLFMRPSFARHLALWLLDAMREYTTER
jgi:sarcosine oxidase subunit gamma